MPLTLQDLTRRLLAGANDASKAQSPTTYFIALSVSAAKRKQRRIAWSMDSSTSAYCKMLHLGAEPGRPYGQTAYMPSFPLPESPILAVAFQSSR